MQKNWIFSCLLGIGLMTGPFFMAKAQPTSPAEKKIRIALFAPLFLDSAFDNTNIYRYPAQQFPKFMVPGLEFYEGALLALDSLNKEGASIDLSVFDNRSAEKSITDQLNSPSCQGADLIITYCSASELKLFAAVGKERKIPVVNINLPNDGGVQQNPYLVLLNSTLPSQCQSIYGYIRSQFSKQTLVVFQKKGALESRIRTYIEEAARKRGGTPAPIKFVELSDSFTVQQLTPWVDTIRSSVCWVASVDENFGKRISQQLVTLGKQRYKITVMGMPIWDGIKDFAKPEYRGADLFFCTPFYSPRTDSLSQSIEAFFASQLYARPSDMVLRGYECIWHFSKLLLRYQKEIDLHLGSKEFFLFREMDIQPLLLPGQPTTPQYYENKKLYYLKWQDGFLKRAN